MTGRVDANAGPDAEDDDLAPANAADVFRLHSTGGSLAISEVGSATRDSASNTVDDATIEVLRLVDAIAPEAFKGLRPHRRKVLASRLVKKARGWGMSAPHDMAIFCVLSRYPGPKFFRRQAWLDAAERVRSGQTTWAQVFQEPQIWIDPGDEKKA